MAKRLSRLDDVAWLTEQAQSKSNRLIARGLKCTVVTVSEAMTRYGITPFVPVCRWCGKQTTAILQHEPHCIMRPEVHNATATALDDGTGYIRSTLDYRRACSGTPAASERVLVGAFGNWAGVAEHFGLELQTARRTNEICDEVAAELQLSRQAVASCREYAPFEACRWYEDEREIRYVLR